jgi:hypothetical protein
VQRCQIEKQDDENNVLEMTLPPPEQCYLNSLSRKPVKNGQVMHMILGVSDSGSQRLTSFRRVVIQTTNNNLKGGTGYGEITDDAMRALNKGDLK